MKVTPLVNHRWLLNVYRRSLKNLINQYIENGTLSELVNLYGRDKVLDISSTVYIENSCMFIPTDSSIDGKIVRWIEYGGPHVPALHLITRSKEVIW